MTIKPVTLKRKVINLTALLIILSGIATALYILYLCLWPVKTIEYKNIPFTVLTKTVKAGDDVKYQVDYCRYLDMPTKATRLLANDIIYTLPVAEVRSPMGCHTTVTSVQIPKGVEPGRYKVTIRVSWKINPLREITQDLETETFNIIE